MAGLSATSRAAIARLLQEWREAFDEHERCERDITRLRMRMDGLEAAMADASAREADASAKLAETASEHADDPAAIDEINALIAESVKGIPAVCVVSGGGEGEVEL